MADNYMDKLNKLMSKPVIPQKPDEDKLDKPVAFPDSDATEEEIAEYLKE